MSVEPCKVLTSVEPCKVLNSVEPCSVLTSVEPCKVLTSVEPCKVLTSVEPCKVLERFLSTRSGLRESQLSELPVLVEALADTRPVPFRALSIVVVDAVEVGAPGRPRPGRDVRQRRQQRIRDEELRAPSLNRCVRFLRSARGARRFARQAIAL